MDVVVWLRGENAPPVRGGSRKANSPENPPPSPRASGQTPATRLRKLRAPTGAHCPRKWNSGLGPVCFRRMLSGETKR